MHNINEHQKPLKKGGDLNRKVNKIKCQWCKNMRAEQQSHFKGLWEHIIRGFFEFYTEYDAFC